MKGIQHGTGDKRGECAPALVDVPRSQGKVGAVRGAAVKVPRRKRPKLKEV